MAENEIKGTVEYRAIGVDAGLTVTTLCVDDVDFWSLKPPKNDRTSETTDVERLVWLVESVIPHIDTDKSCLLAIEGYSYGSPGRQHALAEWGGVLRVLAWQYGECFVIVPPTVLKKFATGKGNVDKARVAGEVAKRWGVVGDEHMADAYVLYRIASALLPGANAEGLTKAQTAIVEVLRPQIVVPPGAAWPGAADD